MLDAPLVVVPLANKHAYLERYAQPDKGWVDRAEERWPVPCWYIDTGMATLLMLLTAVDEGLDAAFFGIMPSDDSSVSEHTTGFRTEFGIPDEYTPIGGITVGYRATDTPPQDRALVERMRRPAEEVIHRGHWGRHDAG